MIKWIEELPDEEQRSRVIRNAFLNVAATEAGEIVFATIFAHLKLFEPTKGPVDEALSNYGKYLLTYFGSDVQYKILESITESAKAAIRNTTPQGVKNAT